MQSHTDRAKDIREDLFQKSSYCWNIDDRPTESAVCRTPDPLRKVGDVHARLTRFELPKASSRGMPAEFRLRALDPLLLRGFQARSFDPSPAFAAGTSD
jgi:hypothetical protein